MSKVAPRRVEPAFLRISPNHNYHQTQLKEVAHDIWPILALSMTSVYRLSESMGTDCSELLHIIQY